MVHVHYQERDQRTDYLERWVSLSLLYCKAGWKKRALFAEADNSVLQHTELAMLRQ